MTPEPLTLLLIDDDFDDQRFFTMALQQIAPQATCILANNAGHARALFKLDPGFVPDYIFLDINLPRKNGKEFLDELQRFPQLRHLPVIIYSTSRSPEDLEDTIRLGAAHYMVKPDDIDELAGLLAALLNNRRPS